jgi:hypothetical protein
MSGKKNAFSPLLPPGRHVMAVEELREITVTAFTGSRRRERLFSELERLVFDLNQAQVICELWVDGSYLTEKTDPEDIDLSFAVWVQHLESLDPSLQSDLLANLNGGKAYSPALDTYFCARFLREDPRCVADTTAYWGEKWGKGWDDWLKGYAVIKLGETDVGYRLFA